MKMKQRLGEGKVDGDKPKGLKNIFIGNAMKVFATSKQTWEGVGFLLLILVMMVGFGSCGNMRRVTYFNGVKDSTLFDSLKAHALIIEPGAQLSIQISSLNMEIDNLINKANLSSVQNYGNGMSGLGGGITTGGYYVGDSGYIKLPRIGNLYVKGWTMPQLEDTLQNRYSEFAKNPLVTVRMLNFVVTILGEVGRTGPISITADRADLLQVLGITGDISNYGKRQNITIIRKTETGRILRKLDITKPEFVTSEFFYVKPGDVIYVEPNAAKKFSTTLTNQFMPIVMSATTFVLLLYNVFTN